MSNIDKIRQEIERLVKMNKTKNGFPASFLCAVRIESYVKLLSFIDSLPDEPVDYAEELKKCKDNPLYFYDKYVKVKQEPADWKPSPENRVKELVKAGALIAAEIDRINARKEE